ncbi:H-NS histone family protein [Roseovarius sp. MBR-6]|uniref:H-NS histone family protein n=1 Tax=Roseovarius sp. MBR-6 TaxID=3156459 RepID=UPI003393A55A
MSPVRGRDRSRAGRSLSPGQTPHPPCSSLPLAPHAAAKYRHPENPALTWSGRGRKPQWFVEALDAGNTASDLAAPSRMITFLLGDPPSSWQDRS